MQKCEFLIDDFPEQKLTPVTHASCGIRGPGRQSLYGEKETHNEHAADRKKPPQALCCLRRRGPPEQGLEPVTHTACGTQKLFSSYFTRPTFDRCAKKKALPLPPAARLPFSDNSSTFKCAVQTNYHSFFSVEDRKRRYPSVSPFSMAPPTGLEPVTLRLTAECSTD